MPDTYVNGTRLYYDVAGPDDGPAVVLIHGFSLDTRMWEEQVAALADRYRVVRYDLRGFGRSAVPEAGVHYHHYQDLVALLDHLEIERAALVGLSLGGAVALDFVLCRPERASALVLIDAVLPGFPTPDASAISGPIWRTGRAEGADAARALWLDCPLFEVANQRPDARERLWQIIADYSGWGWTDPDPGTWAEPACHTLLERINLPTLVIVGERDIVDFRRMADALAAGISGARNVVLPGLGHMPNMEDPEVFNRVLLDFLATTLS